MPCLTNICSQRGALRVDADRKLTHWVVNFQSAPTCRPTKAPRPWFSIQTFPCERISLALIIAAAISSVVTRLAIA